LLRELIWNRALAVSVTERVEVERADPLSK